MKKQLFYLFTLFLLLSCNQKIHQPPIFHASEPSNVDTFETPDTIYQFNNEKISVHGDLASFKPSYTITPVDSLVYLIQFKIESDFPATPPRFKLRIELPRNNVNNLWSAETWSNKSFFNFPNYDKAASPYGIISAIDENDLNQFTYSCKDNNKTKFLAQYVEERSDTLFFYLDFFSDNPPITDITDYDAEVRVDLRQINYTKVIADVAKWKVKEQLKRIDNNRKNIREPIYSAWYPMHRNIPIPNLTRQLDSISNYGFKSMLIDDGWQSLVSSKIDSLGNWDASEMNEMLDFISKSKERNFQVYLWYSLPFSGGNPKIINRFKDKFIRYRAPRQIYVIDPRYPDVRKHLTHIYKNMLVKWEVDGFWFDFINDFYPDENVMLKEDLGRDFIAVYKAIDTLLVDMKTQLKYIQPNLFFSQSIHTAGPSRFNYQTSLSGFVGIRNIQSVKEKMVNNRILFGENSPFMEVMAIDSEDTPIQIALKFQSILFEVPHLSFFPATISPENQTALHFWLNYWRNNSHILLDGEFAPLSPSKAYPIIKSKGANKEIIVSYNHLRAIHFPAKMPKQLDIINSTPEKYITVLHPKSEERYQYQIFDACGKVKNSGVYKFKKSRNKLSIPPGGIIQLKVIFDKVYK